MGVGAECFLNGLLAVIAINRGVLGWNRAILLEPGKALFPSKGPYCSALQARVVQSVC